MKPSSFSCLGTRGSHKELFGLLLSISIFHKGVKVFCSVDSYTKDYILNSTPELDLNIKWSLSPEKYSGLDRQSMIDKNVWRDFLMEKAVVINEALKEVPDTLFLDADILLLDEINDIDHSKQLGVSPHYIQKQSTDAFGYYNGGVLWTNQKTLMQDWIEFTKTSRFCDQAAIEDLANKYEFFEFDENYNFSWWRVSQSDKQPQDIVNNISIKDKIYYKGKPLKFIHTHFYEQREDISLFNNIIIKLLHHIKDYKSLLIIDRIVSGFWNIKMPKQPMAGIWNHSNDSFRELLTLIRDSNDDVNLEITDSVNHIWLNNVLLYDRPNMDWIDNTAINSYKLLLGNGDIDKEGEYLKNNNVNVSPWIFWPRRPSIVQKKIKSEGIVPHKERCVESIFIGNYENYVQQEFRTNDSWEEVIEEFYCTSGSKHLFSQDEYLDKIRKAKYGLCLRGFGSKCHREVELMAFGTVPVVTPEVSIKSYLEQPIENEHYILVSSPSEFKSKISEIKSEKWKEMSESCVNWYYRNIHSDKCWNTTMRGLLNNV